MLVGAWFALLRLETDFQNGMASMMLRVIIFVFGVLSALSCTKQSHRELSKPHFTQFDSPSQCTFTYGYFPEIKLCVQSGGASKQAVARQTKYLQIGIGKWMDALRQVDPRITNKVTLTCDRPHFTATVYDGSGVATSGCGQTDLYAYESTGDDSGEDIILQGTTLHELGHGLAGLGDTYMGRQAGDCAPGQPESIMCWGGYGSRKDSSGYKTLYDDDIKGIQQQFKQFQSYMVIPPGGIPPVGSVPPATGGVIPLNSDLFAAITSGAAGSNTQVMLASTSDATVNISVCDQSSIQNCADPFVTAGAAFSPVNNNNGRLIYKMEGFIPDPAKTYTLLMWKAKGQAIGARQFRFKAK